MAFDTSGTLIHVNRRGTGYDRDETIEQLLRDLIKHKDRLGLAEVAVISAAPQQAQQELDKNGLGETLEKAVEDKLSFYGRMEREGRHVLVVDDDFMTAMPAQAHIDPQDKNVQTYLNGSTYRAALKHG